MRVQVPPLVPLYTLHMIYIDDDLIVAVEGEWEDLPVDFACPECGCGKEDYEAVDN